MSTTAHLPDTLRSPLIARPNPALAGGELVLAALVSVKQSRYAETRQRHRVAWFAAETRRRFPHWPPRRQP